MPVPCRVRHIETNREFASCAASDKFYNFPRSTTSHLSLGIGYKEGYTFERLPDTVYDPENRDPSQEFKPIPGYEGLYSISPTGAIRCEKFKERYKHPTTTKSNQHLVMLYKHGVPHAYIVETLIRLTYFGEKSNHPKFQKKSKRIKCIEDNKIFQSIIDCAVHYRYEYSNFRNHLHANGEYLGRHFVLLD